MYFCPCSCSNPDGENEEDVLICLPRNLSYVGESYLDRYSVSSAFVHNAKVEKQLFNADVRDGYVKSGASECEELLRLQQEEDEQGDRHDLCDSSGLSGARAMADSPADGQCRRKVVGGECANDESDRTMKLATSPTVNYPFSLSRSAFRAPLTVTIDRDTVPHTDFDRYVTLCVESPDSDVVSEEGIFVNMMDDLDALEPTNGKSTLSEASDDTCVSGDSMFYSPEELDGMDDDNDLHVSIEAAVTQAAAMCLKDNNLSSLPVKPGSPPSAHKTVANNPKMVLDSSVTNTMDSEVEQTNTVDSEVEQSPTPVVETSDCVEVEACSECKADNTVTRFGGSEINMHRDWSSEVKSTVIERPRPLPYDDKGPLTSSYRDLLSPESPVYEDQEFNFTRADLRKSASLKSTKTPPGTPRRKKVVRFADAMGLDLESVRHILNLESPPKIPASAMKDLQHGLSQDRKDMGTKHIVETFPQPGADINFRERVLGQKVVLENALVVAGSITGLVRVANVSFHKEVRVRYTTNNWATFHDIAASYMANSNDGPTDRFSFTISPPSDFGPGSKLQFAVSYNAGGLEYWDNNYGHNYIFDCFAKTTPTEVENAWMHFL